MTGFLIGFFTIILVLLSLFVVLVILMQKSGSEMGTAMGGGSLESAFGVSTTNVLTRATSYGLIAFFLLTLGLYLGTLHNSNPVILEDGLSLPEISLTELPIEANPSVEAVENGTAEATAPTTATLAEPSKPEETTPSTPQL